MHVISGNNIHGSTVPKLMFLETWLQQLFTLIFLIWQKTFYELLVCACVCVCVWLCACVRVRECLLSPYASFLLLPVVSTPLIRAPSENIKMRSIRYLWVNSPDLISGLFLYLV